MDECDYCGDAFDEESAYLEHLRSEHGDELSRIDRRRVEEASGDGSQTGTRLLVLAGVALLFAGIAYFAFGGGGGNGGGGVATPAGTAVAPSGIAAEPLPEQGDDALLSDVESVDGLSRNHVSGSVDYEQVPPVGGDHWSSTVDVGFYTRTPQLEPLVHNLEHGHVVIYYDPDALSADAEGSLREFAAAHTDTWASVIVAPNPSDDPRADYVLTAWGHRLAMDDYDPEVVQAFLAEYLGRGPENPVR